MFQSWNIWNISNLPWYLLYLRMRVCSIYCIYCIYLRMRVYILYLLLYLLYCIYEWGNLRIHSHATDTLIHAKNIGEQKIGEEHSAKNVPAKNMTRRNVRNPILFDVTLSIQNPWVATFTTVMYNEHSLFFIQRLYCSTVYGYQSPGYRVGDVTIRKNVT